MEDLDEALEKEAQIVFLLNGNMLTIEEQEQRVLEAKKFPFIHLDMVEGFEARPIVVDYLSDRFGNDCGIITTRNSIVRKCIAKNIRVVQRFFALDSLSVDNFLDQLDAFSRLDAIEIIPGVLPKIIKRVHERYPHIPLISGGLIRTEQEIQDALKAGCYGISTTRKSLWQ